MELGGIFLFSIKYFKVGQCSNEAISLVRDEKRGVPLDVRLLA